MKIRVSTKSAGHIETEAVVLLFFQDERPLKGASGMVDWRMCGAISNMILSERISGEKGESILIAPSRKIKGKKILMIGLGISSEIDEEKIRKTGMEVINKLANIGVRNFSIAMPPKQFTSIEVSRMAAAILKGMKEAGIKDDKMFATLLVEKEDKKEVGLSIDKLRKI